MKRALILVIVCFAISIGHLAKASSAGQATIHPAREGRSRVDRTAPFSRSYRPNQLDLEGWDSLLFSKTQSWDAEMKGRIDRFDGWITHEDYESLVLPAPPANSSAQTRAELDYLLELRSLRDARSRGRIESEISLAGFWMPERIRANGGPVKFPATERMVLEVMAQAQTVVMSFKSRFDRVRPSYLAEQIEPTIDVPSHPAYPSGHATQSHILAYLFLELDAGQAEQYLERAREIAWHRELAGVHYPSDSFAGALLARQIVDLLWSKPQFQVAFAAARREWQRALSPREKP